MSRFSHRYAELPGYAEITETAAAVAARIDAVRAARPMPDPGAAADRLLGGERLEELVEDFSAAAREVDLAAREVDWLNRVQAHLSDRVTAFERDPHNLAAVVEAMAAELAEIVSRAVTADRALGRIETAEDATASPETAAAWAELRALTVRWRTLTAEHQALLLEYGRLSAGPDIVRAWRESGLLYVVNAADLDPERSIREDRCYTAEPSWPNPEQQPEAFLRWLAGPEAEPWLPTVTQVQAAHRELLERRAEAHEGDETRIVGRPFKVLGVQR